MAGGAGRRGLARPGRRMGRTGAVDHGGCDLVPAFWARRDRRRARGVARGARRGGAARGRHCLRLPPHRHGSARGGRGRVVRVSVGHTAGRQPGRRDARGLGGAQPARSWPHAVNVLGVIAAIGVAAAFVLASWLVRPAVRRGRLGFVHPGPIWLGLTGAFFGAGSGFLAITGGSVAPALYVGGCVLGFGIGVRGSDWLARRRGDAVAVDGSRQGGPGPGTRGPMPALLAVVALLAVAPTLAVSGIPFLATDITGSRTELTGIPIQLIRVCLPGLAGILLFDGLSAGDRRRRLVAGVGIAAIAGFLVLLASRYLVLELVAALAIAWLLAGRTLPRNVVMASGALVIVGFGAIQVVRAFDQAASDPLGFAVERSVNRILLIQPRTLDALQHAIPAEQPFYLGLTWIHRLGPLVGRDDIPNLGYWIYPRVVEGAQD